MVEQGVTSFKLFLAYPGALMVDDDTLFAVMERAAANGGLVMIHAENGHVIDTLVQASARRGQHSPRGGTTARARPRSRARAPSARSRSPRSPMLPLYVVHVTCEEAVDAIARARHDGQRVWGETCTQYLHLTQDDLDRPGFEGAKFVCSPPLRTEADQARLWEAIRRDELEVISTDHCPFNFEGQKTLGHGRLLRDPQRDPRHRGAHGLLSEAVHEGHLSVQRLVEVDRHQPGQAVRLLPAEGHDRPRLGRRHRRVGRRRGDDVDAPTPSTPRSTTPATRAPRLAARRAHVLSRGELRDRGRRADRRRYSGSWQVRAPPPLRVHQAR